MHVAGQQLLELVPELRHALAQHGRVERHVDAGHQDERPLAAEFGTAALDLGLELLETLDRAGNRVLRAAQVQVDDLEELTGALADPLTQSMTSASGSPICEGRMAAIR